MSWNSFFAFILLVIFFVFSGIDHRFLYFLYATFGFLALHQSRFVIKSRSKRFFEFLVLFFIIHIIQITFYFEGLFSVQGFLRYISFFFLYFFLGYIQNGILVNFLRTITYVIVLTLPIGLYIAFVKGGRYEFIFEHGNHLAYVCVLLAFFFLKIDVNSRLVRNSIVLFLGLIILTAKSTGGLLTYSILVVYTAMSSGKSKFFSKAFASIPIIGLLILLFSLSERFRDQLEFISFYNIGFIMERVQLHQAGGVGSGLWRIIHWFSILYEFSRESFTKILFGLGADTMSQGHYHYSFMITDPHNDFVRITAEFGLVGLAIFIFYYLRLVASLNHKWHILIISFVPMFLGNIIVNYPYVLIASILIILLKSKGNEENSVNNAIAG